MWSPWIHLANSYLVNGWLRWADVQVSQLPTCAEGIGKDTQPAYAFVDRGKSRRSLFFPLLLCSPPKHSVGRIFHLNLDNGVGSGRIGVDSSRPCAAFLASFQNNLGGGWRRLKAEKWERGNLHSDKMVGVLQCSPSLAVFVQMNRDPVW